VGGASIALKNARRKLNILEDGLNAIIVARRFTERREILKTQKAKGFFVRSAVIVHGKMRI